MKLLLLLLFPILLLTSCSCETDDIPDSPCVSVSIQKAGNLYFIKIPKGHSINTALTIQDIRYTNCKETNDAQTCKKEKFYKEVVVSFDHYKYQSTDRRVLNVVTLGDGIYVIEVMMDAFYYYLEAGKIKYVKAGVLNLNTVSCRE